MNNDKMYVSLVTTLVQLSLDVNLVSNAPKYLKNKATKLTLMYTFGHISYLLILWSPFRKFPDVK